MKVVTTVIKVALVSSNDPDMSDCYEAYFEDEPEITGEGSDEVKAIIDLYEAYDHFYAGYSNEDLEQIKKDQN